MDLLEVQSISKTYGSGEAAVHALKNVSFSVPKGEYVAIVGESGSGKSTLLNMIGALDNPTSGKVLIEGKDIFAMKESKRTIFRRRNIGFIFQAFNLIPELTVEQNIIFPILLDYQKPNQKYLEELLEVLNLKERRNHLPGSNYVYEKVYEGTHTAIGYKFALPRKKIFTWDQIGHFRLDQNLLMHSLCYRTDVLRESNLPMPPHTFYVDNIFVYEPLPHVPGLGLD